ncbi:MAG: response regulator [Armatimonadetes bacterium]|nr:response regulator [Armatimonadota bacterium]
MPDPAYSDDKLAALTELAAQPGALEERAEAIVRLLADGGGTCALRAREGERVRTLAAAGPALAAALRPEPEELLARALAGETVLIPDLAAERDLADSWRLVLTSASVRSAAVLPVPASAVTLSLFSHLEDAWDNFDAGRQALLAKLVGLALAQPRADHGGGSGEAMSSRYRSAIAELHANRDLDDACRRAVAELAELFHCDYAVVARRLGEAGSFDTFEAHHRHTYAGGEAPVLEAVAAAGKPLLNPPATPEDQLLARAREAGVGTWLVFPLNFRDEILGGLLLGWRRAGEVPVEVLSLVERFAFHVALALRDAGLRHAQEQAVARLREAQYEATQGAKFRALAQMAGGVAHEFNNALGGILARTQILQRQTQDRRVLKGLTTISDIGWRAAETVRRLQEFTRARSEDDFRSVPVPDLWAHLKEAARAQVAEYGRTSSSRYHVELEQGALDGSLLASPDELAEALGNVLRNALEATPGGGVVSVHAHTASGHLHLVVVDRGRGMSADEQQSAFDPFYSTKAETGVGLGLSVTYGIVSRHRGEIEIESTPAVGTTVNITLPLAVPAEEKPHRTPHVLVIDDEQALCEVLAELFSSQGFEVDTCSGGREGIEHYHANVYDLVCTDLRTEDLSGWEVIRAVKTAGRGTPVMLLTGFREQLRPDQIEDSGVDAVLGKPFTLQQVLDTSAQLLGIERE